MAGGGFHTVSLVDEISYMNPPSPLISQYYDLDQTLFCNGDKRPHDCGDNCMCTHKVEIPLNSLVEVVVVDEGLCLKIHIHT